MMNIDDNDRTVIEKSDFHRTPARIYCPSCGKQLLPDANFCKYCGKQLGNIKKANERASVSGNRKKGNRYSTKGEKFRQVQDNLNVVWPGWKVERLIGGGAFGKVYHITRTDELGYRFESALKIISIPSSQQDVRSAISAGMDEAAATAYFRSMVEDMAAEIVLMSQLKGITNIVSYEDHAILKDGRQIRWDIYIRMEYLTPLLDYIGRNPFTVRDVLKLGIDMCNALELCEKSHIIHRDIKPENIFVSDVGNYKLGDFGIARQMEKTSSVYSKKGTPSYMAPEVYKGEEYNATVDIYSLSMVLYWLLNNNRAPCMPPWPGKICYSDNEEAIISRMKGEPFAGPCHAGEELSAVILKACSFSPDQRYNNAFQFRQALKKILDSPDFEANYPPVNILPEKDPETDQSLNLQSEKLDSPEDQIRNPQPESEYADDRVYAGRPDPDRDEEERGEFATLGYNNDYRQYKDANSPGSGRARHYDRGNRKLSPYMIFLTITGVTIVLLLTIILFLLFKRGGDNTETIKTEATTTTSESTEDTNDTDSQGYSENSDSSDSSSNDESGPLSVAMQYEKDAVLAPVEYDGHAFAVFNYKEDLNLTSYYDCEKYCEEMGGHLAIIDSQEKNDFLYFDYLRKNNKEAAMFGYSNPRNTGDPDDWEWVDGLPRDYTNWSSKGNQPNNSTGNEQYGQFFKDTRDGTWNDSEFGVNTYLMICEWE